MDSFDNNNKSVTFASSKQVKQLKNNITMNNEETIIMQPQNSGASEKKNINNTTDEVKNTQAEKTGSTGKRVAATVAAGVFGGAVGGAGSVAAANMMNAEEPEVQVEEAAPATEAKPEAAPTVEAKEEEVPVIPDENGEPDYSGQGGADPVVTPQPTSNETEPEVQVLGVYENEAGQELAILTDGETVAAVLDANGDGEANVIGIDENHNGQFEEGEIHDITDQHISMQPIEQDYLAQQQMEAEQHDSFAYNASDEADYNNDADMYYDA